MFVSLQTKEGEDQIQFTLLLRLCDPVARLCLILSTSVRKANLFIYILTIQNSFVLLNISSIKGFMIKAFTISMYACILL